ncbi:MAG: DUF924 family protein [Caulobacteraceae bacterium]
MSGPDTIVRFWREAGPKAWFRKDPAFDAEIRRRFEADHHSAARGEHDGWAQTATGALGLLLLFDQFPRNLWRDSAHAFATDPLARGVARAAIAAGHDRAVEIILQPFVYIPFMHAETPGDQDESVRLLEGLKARGGADNLHFAREHRDIVARFGRFPHRNRCLARETSPDEQAFLDGGGFSG